MPKLPNRVPGKPYTFEQVVKKLVNAPPGTAPRKARPKKRKMPK